MKWQVKTLVDVARDCNRSAIRSRKLGLKSHYEWNMGRATAYLHAARFLGGYTKARDRKMLAVVNAGRSTVVLPDNSRFEVVL